jgi:hypothetical protein
MQMPDHDNIAMFLEFEVAIHHQLSHKILDHAFCYDPEQVDQQSCLRFYAIENLTT